MSDVGFPVALVSKSAPVWVTHAIHEGGGVITPLQQAEAVIWFDRHDSAAVRDALLDAPQARWVHLLSAGVDGFIEAFDHDHIWTCGKGLSAATVAEHALLLALSGLRGLAGFIEAKSWTKPGGVSLYGQRVTVVGGGGSRVSCSGTSAAFDCDVTVVRRQASPLDNAARVLTVDRLHDALPGAQVVFYSALADT